MGFHTTLPTRHNYLREKNWRDYSFKISLVQDAIKHNHRELAEFYFEQAEELYKAYKTHRGKRPKELTKLPWNTEDQVDENLSFI